MLANLWMLKAANGMFWYAVDYIARLERPCRVVVRPALATLARRELAFPGVTVHAVGFAGFLREVLTATLGRRFIYTPTPHPVPFVRRQLVVFHDEFPFEGPRGACKRRLLRAGVLLSRCRVGHINRSVALPYLLGLGVPAGRLVYAPNVPPAVEPLADPRAPAAAAGRLRIGAFGTDSPKKRYPQLLDALGRPPYRERMQLCIYGGINDYARGLVRDFAAHPPLLYDPADVTLREFLLGVDAVVSIAPNEGFGRPIATAIGLGLPCCLIDSPAFREFFDGLAWLEPDVPHVLWRLLAVAPGVAPQRRHAGFLSSAYRQAVDAAVAEIQRQA